MDSTQTTDKCRCCKNLVPLTDEEIEDIWADCPADWDDKINVLTLARAIEAKLKEKNT